MWQNLLLNKLQKNYHSGYFSIKVVNSSDIDNRIYKLFYDKYLNIRLIEKMDVWEKLYYKAKDLYHPQYISPFIYCNHVVSALESENGNIYTGFCIRSCSGVGNLCAERVAAINMLNHSGQTKIKRIITFRNQPPANDLSVPCGACREFLMQLSIDNANTEILLDYKTQKIILLGELIPQWWGYEKTNENNKR